MRDRNKYEKNIFIKKLIKMKFKKQIFAITIKNKTIKRNFCLQTGWNHSVNSLYLLSRMSLKESLRSRLLTGLKKISW